MTTNKIDDDDTAAAADKHVQHTPRPTTLSDLRDLPAVPLVSETKPNAAGALGISFWGAYDLARRGDIPTLKVGRRKLVSVPALLKMLGAE